MRLKLVLLVLLAALVAAPAVSAQAETRELMPGVMYTREVKSVRGREVVIHVVTAPRPGGLYELAPVLGGGTLTGRETVTSMQSRLAGSATVVGVNGDLYNVELGFPTGMVLQDGIMHGRPMKARSTLGIGADGSLLLDRVGFLGLLGIADMARQRLDQFNRPLPPSGIGLFTPSWGSQTPAQKGALEIVLSNVPGTAPNVDLGGQVVEVRRGGGGPIPPGGAVLQATGADAAGIEALAVPGTSVFFRLNLNPWWADARHAIGGGPALIRNGQIALPTSEQFSGSQLTGRHPRTAVGQLGDGRIVLVAVDGRSTASAGMSMGDLARELQSLGAVTAMALDGGGGTTLAFDARLLNVPSDGAERSVTNALMLRYYGAYAAPPDAKTVSPNGDGVAEEQRLLYKLVRPSTVDVRVVGPGGGILFQDTGVREPGTFPIVPDLAGRPEGRWRLVVRATDDLGRESVAEREFALNNTLGFLVLSKQTVKVTKRGGRLGVAFSLAHNATLAVTVENSKGRIVRTVFAGWRKKGAVELEWNGRSGRGKAVPKGRYTICVAATNRFGEVSLQAAFGVSRR
jgi:hypothetical protein